MQSHLNQAERNAYNQQLSKIKAVESKHPGAPGRAMVVNDNAQPHEPVIFLRGQPGNRGEQVPRRFLQVLSHVDGGQPFTHGSGRLELARAIASPDNPLTARVIVNRIWQMHFGHGLVRTASDFGSRGESPSHPELLDYLAAEFMRDGWSIKRLQRRIMLSATWQQSSFQRADAFQVDPENRLLWHYPRRRLEFEPLRDRILAVSGKLDRTVGGRSVMIHQDATRRALYAYIDREDVPSLLASFDVPSPDASQATRSRTTVPQQALYLLNSPFVIQQAESLAARVKAAVDSDSQSQFTDPQTGDPETGDPETGHPEMLDIRRLDIRRIVQLYRVALAREPDQQEIALALAFVSGQPLPLSGTQSPDQPEDQTPPPTPSPWRFGYGHWDTETLAVRFTPFEHFSGQRWQASSDFPDATLGHAMLVAGGGHPGNQSTQSSIVRWIAPSAGRVTISGVLKHLQAQGDGVRGILVSSRAGVLGSWSVFNQEMKTRAGHVEVEQGETLDFIVDCNQNPSHDSYEWSPKIRVSKFSSGELEPGTVWNLASDFSAASLQQLPPKSVDPGCNSLKPSSLATNSLSWIRNRKPAFIEGLFRQTLTPSHRKCPLPSTKCPSIIA
jgi:hypothetical protein